MTMQCPDLLFYKSKKYIISDSESEIIETADFPKVKYCLCETSCRRGYLAEYFIEDNKLYGIKFTSEFENGESESAKLPMNYTGSILAVYVMEGKFMVGFADFFSRYLEADEAYEFYFIDGELCDVHSLQSAIDEWKNVKQFITQNNKGKRKNKNASEVLSNEFELQDRIAIKHLKYDYRYIKLLKKHGLFEAKFMN